MWCGPKVGTSEGKHGTRVRGKKDVLTKVTKDSVRESEAYYPVGSNIGSRTTISFPDQNGSSSVQNGNSSFQNGNSSVQSGKIIISINIKHIL